MRITKTISLHHGMEKQWRDRGRDGKDGKVANVECYLSIPSPSTPPPRPQPHPSIAMTGESTKQIPTWCPKTRGKKRKYTDWPRATQLQHRLIGNTHVLFLGGRDPVSSE